MAPVPLVLAATAGWVWSRAAGSAAWGWATAASLVILALADGALFASLPRRRLSFGPVQTPFLGLSLARWLLALAAAVVAGSWPALAWGAGTAVQALVWALVAHGTLVEPFRVQITHLEIPSPKLPNPGLPLRIVQLSDLHVERLTRRERSLPGLGAVLTSSHFWKRYEAGHYRQGDTDLYVSQGLGMEGFGAPRARFFCRPEIVVAMLRGMGNGSPGGEKGAPGP